MKPRTIAQIEAQDLASIYRPQEQSIMQRRKMLPQEFLGKEQSLKQAKVNAFRDITNTANSRGMLFSGFTPAEEARYLGETYLPGMQQLEYDRREKEMSLMDMLNQLYADRRTRAIDIRENELQRYQRQKEFEAQQALERERMALERAKAYAPQPFEPGKARAYKKYYQDDRGNKIEFNEMAYEDETGRPISAAQYAAIRGLPLETVLQSDSSVYAQRAANAIDHFQRQGFSYENALGRTRALFPKVF